MRPCGLARGLCAGPGGWCGAAPRLCSCQLPLGARGGPWGPVVTGSLCPRGGARGSLTPGGHGGPPWVSVAGMSCGFPQLWSRALGLFLPSSAFVGGCWTVSSDVGSGCGGGCLALAPWGEKQTWQVPPTPTCSSGIRPDRITGWAALKA